MRLSRSLTGLATAILVAGCGGGGSATPPPPPMTYTATGGVAQKGPLIKGSTVVAQELDAKLSPTGKQYSYQITSDLGAFSPTSTFSNQYIGLNASGYYFDEVANAVSTGTATLNGYSDLTAVSVLNVNLLTTLAYQRIQHLVTGSGMTFAAAKTQAEKEVLTALNIPVASYGSFGTLDLGGGTDGDHILAAISAIFVYGNSAGPLSQLIANFQSDIGTNGVITSVTTKSALTSAGKSLNPTAVAANLTQAYTSVGVTFTAEAIGAWIDQDGDGVIGKFKFQVSDATPSSVFTFPSFVVDQVSGTSVSVTGGRLSINGMPVTGSVIVQKGDVVTLTPGVGPFQNGVLNCYLLSGTTRTGRVSFVSGLLSIAVTPSAPNVPKGLTQHFTATGTFSDTSTADLTNSVVWTSDAPTVATVNATSGVANSVAVGSTVVTATSGSVSGNTTLNVTAAALESVVITPNPAFAGIGIAKQLTANGTYSDGTAANVTNVANWTSSIPAVATVGPTTGLTTGVSLGSATISATIGSLTAQAPLAIVTNTWFPAGSPSIGRANHTATLLPNGKVLVAGGQGGGASAPTASTELYDPVTNTWSAAAAMATARSSHTATLLPNGKVLVAGGLAGGQTSSTANAELYDPAANTWSAAPAMAYARDFHTATLLANGKVLAAGGQSYNLPGTTDPTRAELYDPVANTWSAAAAMTTPRGYPTATLLPNGKVLVAGGNYLGGSANAELYDPVADTWSATPMATGRYSPTATLLQNGKVLVAGGETAVVITGGPLPCGATAIAELYDPVTDTWSSAGSLLAARERFTATLLSSGKVLVAGGLTCPVNNILASAELYDPVANTWSAAAAMTIERYFHTATLLPNGVVMVADGAQGVAGTAEVYYP